MLSNSSVDLNGKAVCNLKAVTHHIGMHFFIVKNSKQIKRVKTAKLQKLWVSLLLINTYYRGIRWIQHFMTWCCRKIMNSFSSHTLPLIIFLQMQDGLFSYYCVSCSFAVLVRVFFFFFLSCFLPLGFSYFYSCSCVCACLSSSCCLVLSQTLIMDEPCFTLPPRPLLWTQAFSVCPK